MPRYQMLSKEDQKILHRQLELLAEQSERLSELFSKYTYKISDEEILTNISNAMSTLGQTIMGVEIT